MKGLDVAAKIETVLVGRDVERDRIARVLAAARRGRSGCLVVRGEAGIGKTALIEDATRSARGMTVLRVRGVESEAELPYAGLLTLARPVLELLPALPKPQADALAGALALAPDPAADQLAVCAATLALLVAASERRPLLVVVDDAHWLDVETAQAIGFAARRLAHERIALLLAVRDGETSAFAADGLDELALAGLDEDAAGHLLGAGVAESVARRLAEATSGNPLALLELAGTLSPGQLAGVDPVDDPLPVGESLDRAFGRRVGEMPEGSRRALLVAAAAGARDDLDLLARALSRLELTVDEMAAAERAGLVTIADGRLRFRHPLVRAVAYATAGAPDRRAAHAALAAALDRGAEADERAWHLALATTGPDENAAAALEAAGSRAARLSRHAAMRALARAAALTPGGAARDARVLAAARAAVDAGAWDEAARLLGELQERGSDAVDDDDRLFLQAIVASRRDAGTAPAELLEEAADHLRERDPDRAAEALVRAALVWCSNFQRERGLAAAERAAGLPFERGGRTELAVELSLGDAAGWLGLIERAAHHWRRAAELVDDDDPDQLQMAGEALFSAGDDAAAQPMLRLAEALARELGALDTLTLTLLNLGLSQTRSGDLASAHADTIDSVRLMHALGQRSELPNAIANAAWIEAMLGREADCRAHVAEAHALLTGQRLPRPHGGSPIGLLELSRGRPDLAIEPFEESMAVRASELDAEPIAPRPILPSFVEALARVGRTDDAARALGGRVGIARSTGRPDAVAPLLRAHALVHEDEGAYREALAWHGRWSNRFERARTELCYGELLRRLKRRAEARVLLRAAVEHFDSVAAVLWAERARIELAATGERARRRVPSTVDDLTPQEIQVARLVATGLTNREVATRLFLSPKTIETHLGHVFRKTGVRTRAELAHRFRDSPDSIAVPAS